MATAGSFGGDRIEQCTATSKRTGERCQGPAVKGSPTKKCRMHGGTVRFGMDIDSFQSGRFSKYLPSQLDRLYREALSNPDLLELSDNIALLEARIQSILADSADDPVPRWGDVKSLFDGLATAILGGDQSEINKRMATMFETLEAGEKWDTTWDQVTSTMEQLRKLADTEIKRKKELNQMVPVERVVILMAAVGEAVKRNVSNPEEIRAVYRELALLHGTDDVPGNPRVKRIGPEIIDVPSATKRRREKRAAEEQVQ